MKKLIPTLALSALCVSLANARPSVSYTPALGKDADGDTIGSDWSLTCDNIGTCRAVGYNPDADGEGLPVSLLIRQAAGQKSATAFVNLGEEYEEFADNDKPFKFGKVQLVIAGKNYGTVKMQDDGIGQLSQTQLSAILAQKDRKTFDVTFKSDKQVWQLSGKGFKEVMAKLASLPTAKAGTYPVLNDKPFTANGKPHNIGKDDKLSVLAKNSPDGQKLTALLKNHPYPKVGEYHHTFQECDVLDGKNLDDYDREQASSFGVWQIGDNKKLVTGSCWRAAYNMGDAVWVVDDNFSKVYQAVATNISDLNKNQLFVAHKGRGIGDCFYLGTYTWDGEKFVMTYEGNTGECRGFAGGAWQLPTTIIDVASDKDDIKDFKKF